MSPDSIIRMRLAEARRQKSMLHSTPSPSTPTPPTPALEAAASMISMQDLQQGASSVDLIPRGEDAKADTTPPCDTGLHDGNDLNATLSAPSLPVPVAAELPSSRAAAASAPAASKFEARTDSNSRWTYRLRRESMTLCVLCVETRPVFVPSPRGKSPRQHKESECIESSPTKQLDAIFQKSRPSSPRGKSKNIQLIDLKHANNLAIALANFKINSNYEQIAHDIVSLFPTEDERRMLQSYDGPIVKLGKAEQFLYEMVRVPDMHERINVFLYKLEFPRNQRGLLSKIQIVKRACRDLLENYPFLQALEKVNKNCVRVDRLRDLCGTAYSRAYDRSARLSRNTKTSKSGMDADPMAEIIHILVVTWKHGDVVEVEAKGASTEQGAFALDIMEALSQTRRFALLLDFLDNNQLEKIQTLFAMLDRQHESEASKDAS
ncbi:Cortactin-binding protein 2, partial [Globisporangium splendens]